MFVVGLTGGIASGKTAVSDAFAALGVPIIDTDVIARELVASGQPALSEIASQFGQAYLTADGKLNRPQLRQLIFADDGARQRLEAILHPRIQQTVQQYLTQLQTPYCIVVIPLLVETGGRCYINRVLVVDINESLQIERVMARDQINAAQAQQILAVQTSREQRLAKADDVIDNSGSLAELEAKVFTLHQHYLQLAESKV